MKPKQSEDNRKLMDQLRAHPSFGRLMGFVGTTFEMQVDFFETDFLPTLFGLGAWDDRNWSSRIALERHLAELEAATIYQDSGPYRGRPRSMRVEMIPVYLPGQPILHSKVFLALYEHAVLLTIGSANLTEPGYRKNLEVIASFVATEKKVENAGLIKDTISQFRNQLGPWITPSTERLLTRASEFVEQLGDDDQPQDCWIVWSGVEQPQWRRFLEYWPEDEKVLRINVVSPFWSEESDGKGPLTSILSAFHSKGCLAENASVNLYTAERLVAKGEYQPVLPDSVCDIDFESLGVNAMALVVDPNVPSAEIEVEGDYSFNRNLHAKIVLIEGESTQLVYLGSANFTRHGWGFLSGTGRPNIETGIVLRIDKKEASLNSLLPTTVGDGVSINDLAREKLAPLESETEANPWPAFVNIVELRPTAADGNQLELVITTDPELVEGEWSIGVESPNGLLGLVYQEESASTFRVELNENLLQALLKKQEVVIRWWKHPAGTAFPLNVSLEARHTLPVSPEVGNPLEQHLIAYYQGRIRWEDLFPDPDPDPNDDPSDGNPLEEIERSGVDTSGIQSYIVREFVEAIKGINDDLKSASNSTTGCMRLALLGNVSPLALAKRIVEAAKKGERTPTATGFQLVEIRGCLGRAKTYETSKSFSEDWKRLLDRSISEIDGMLDELKRVFPDGFSADFERFESKIKTHYETAVQVP